jgi:hypothetical protein
VSNGRRWRRRARPARIVAAIGDIEIWEQGNVVQVLPALSDHLHPLVKNALDRRRRASLEGRCDCGAKRQLEGPLVRGAVVRAVMEHENHCDASSPRLEMLLEQYGRSA